MSLAIIHPHSTNTKPVENQEELIISKHITTAHVLIIAHELMV